MERIESPLNILQTAFPGIKAEDAQEMVSTGTLSTYPPGAVLCHEGNVEFTFYIILKGEVEVTKVLNEGEARLMKMLGPGDFFGEMAIIHNAPRAATVTTSQTTTLLEINKDSFASVLEHSSSVSLAMVREVSRRLRENDQMAIEDLRLKAKELAQAYQQLAELEIARSQFLTTIAHELRTPLMSANGFLSIVRTGMLQGEALNAALETVSRNLQDIITLTNDILFLQEMDLILPAFEPTDLGAVVAAAVEQQRSRAAQNEVGLRLQIAPVLPRVMADPKSLGRAVAAILDNAIKFSPDGGDVSVGVGVSDGRLFMRCQDQGVGIPPEALPRIYDRFFHLDKIGDRLFRGAGVGLCIARQVIEQHHGQIAVESRLGEGSTFTLWLDPA